MSIKAIPMVYNGIRYRSTLEADWAATMDYYGMHHCYEPVAVETSVGPYLPDFWLPAQRVFLEVKGPHNERLDKAEALGRDADWGQVDPLVVIARPSVNGAADWHGVNGTNPVFVLCPECRHYGFMDHNAWWRCPRACRNGGNNKFWYLPGGGLWWPREIRFERAPRPQRRS